MTINTSLKDKYKNIFVVKLIVIHFYKKHYKHYILVVKLLPILFFKNTINTFYYFQI